MGQRNVDDDEPMVKIVEISDLQKNEDYKNKNKLGRQKSVD